MFQAFQLLIPCKKRKMKISLQECTKTKNRFRPSWRQSPYKSRPRCRIIPWFLLLGAVGSHLLVAFTRGLDPLKAITSKVTTSITDLAFDDDRMSSHSRKDRLFMIQSWIHHLILLLVWLSIGLLPFLREWLLPNQNLRQIGSPDHHRPNTTATRNLHHLLATRIRILSHFELV